MIRGNYSMKRYRKTNYAKNIPVAMKDKPNWCLWKLEERDGRTIKMPYTINGKGAKSNDPNTWASFHDALNVFANSSEYNGLGFFLGKPLVGLDIDHVSNQNPDKINKILNIVKNTYVEVSQSGNGYHAIFKGFKPENTPNKKNGFEMYDHERFFALTADLKTLPQIDSFDGEKMRDLINLTVGFKKDNPVSINPVGAGNDLSSDEIVNRILTSSQADQFKQLYTGNIAGYESPSNADLALCNILAYWTNRDAQKMDAIFRQSKLYRSKWDSKRGATTYGEMTIQKAIDGTPNGFESNRDCKLDISFTETKPKMKNTANNNVIPINGSTAPVLDDETEQDDNWTKYFSYNKTKFGDVPTIKSTAIKNALLILNYDPNFQGLFKYNRFTHDIEVAEDKKIDLNKYGSGVISFPEGSLQDIDTTNFGIYCESRYDVTFKPALIESAIEASARQHSYNPIVDYMNNAKKKWDGKQRLDELFPTFLGAEDDKTTKLITELWFMGGVAKAYNPLTKIDTWLDLVGGQGVGKTTLLQRVAPMGMYTDQFSQFEDKDAMGRMVRAFIINDDEMDASLKCGFAEVKKFTTAIYLQFRPVYMKHDVRVPKGFIMARTTNDEAHLRDATGDRRFMTIRVNGSKQKEKPFNLTPEYAQQLWGEAVHLYESFKASGKNPFILTGESEKLLQDNREQFKQTTGLQDDIENAINDQFAYTKAAGTNQNYIVPTALSQYVFNDETYLSKHRNISSEVNRIMAILGYKKAPTKVGGKTVRCFVYTAD